MLHFGAVYGCWGKRNSQFRYDKFFGMDFEANPTADVQLNEPTGGSFVECDSEKHIPFIDGATSNRIIGGEHANVPFAAGASGNVAANLAYGHTFGSHPNGIISDLGNNSIRRCWSRTPPSWYRRPKEILSMVPVGTMYSWTNTYGDPVILGLVGGVFTGSNDP